MRAGPVASRSAAAAPITGPVSSPRHTTAAARSRALDPLRVCIVDHQGKSSAIAAGLAGSGHELVADPAGADVVLIDHDIPFHGRLQAVEACVAAGGKALLYPHGASATLMAGWDGLYPVSPLLSGALVTAPGHAEVARRYGYPHPVYPVGWSLCELRERRPGGRVENVLFAPVHPPWSSGWNADVFERLLRTPARITVRHVGSLEGNELREVDGVEYVEADLGDFDSMIAQIDAADVVVACKGTFMCLAVARGVTTVSWRSSWLNNNEESAESHHAHLYRDYVRFPFDADDGDLWQTIQAAAADEALAADWRRRFVGDPLDVDALVDAFTQAPKRRIMHAVPTAATARSARELHEEALARVEAGELAPAAELLTEAVTSSVELELLNDLAVVKSALGERDDADALLRACLALEPGHEDAAANLAALAPAGPAAATASWRRSRTLGGPDPEMPERAFPGMKAASAPLMSEHAVRYAHALAFVGGKDVLDLGCGTGYGSEMLTWAAGSVRGFDLWQPAEEERPQWTGGAVLRYGHDLCRDPLPRADLAVMFEVLEHLHQAPDALRLIWDAVDMLVVSFPNPVFHGSHVNQYHVNDWPLDRVEREVLAPAHERFHRVEVAHLTQAPAGIVVPGRDPDGYYWILVAQGRGRR